VKVSGIEYRPEVSVIATVPARGPFITVTLASLNGLLAVSLTVPVRENVNCAGTEGDGVGSTGDLGSAQPNENSNTIVATRRMTIPRFSDPVELARRAS
jgi:hypothetical protein